jgi:hypothetical protein
VRYYAHASVSSEDRYVAFTVGEDQQANMAGVANRVGTLETRSAEGMHRGAWAAATDYKAKDIVVYQGAAYTANTTFTSGGAFNAANWTLLSVGAIRTSTKIGTVGGTLGEYVTTLANTTIHTGPFIIGTGGRLGINSEPSPRNPISQNITIDGSTLDGTYLNDKVGGNLSVTFKGGFSGEVGFGASSATFLFGANDFITTGPLAGAIAGSANIIGRLTEVDILTPDAALNRAVGFQAEVNYYGATAGGTIAQAISLYAVEPRWKSGAAAGAFTEAHSLYIESPTRGTLNRAMTVNGTAESFFGGAIKTNSKNIDAQDGILSAKSIVAGVAGSGAQGRLTVLSNADTALVSTFQQFSGSQSGDMARWATSGGTPLSRVSGQGFIMTRRNAAPADGDLASGEMAIWLDSTNGAAKFMVKAKQADGTVRTGNVALA